VSGATDHTGRPLAVGDQVDLVDLVGTPTGKRGPIVSIGPRPFAAGRWPLVVGLRRPAHLSDHQVRRVDRRPRQLGLFGVLVLALLTSCAHTPACDGPPAAAAALAVQIRWCGPELPPWLCCDGGECVGRRTPSCEHNLYRCARTVRGDSCVLVLDAIGHVSYMVDMPTKFETEYPSLRAKGPEWENWCRRARALAKKALGSEAPSSESIETDALAKEMFGLGNTPRQYVENI